MYGRGISDDGYAFLASVAMIKMLQEAGIPHPRYIIFAENDEESGSNDIMYHMDLFKDKIGKVDLIVCLDSGCYDYDHFYQTTTLRGNSKIKITIKTMNISQHSGVCSGVFPDVFRIFRTQLDRLEDPKTGRLIDELYGNIPPELYADACKLTDHLGPSFFDAYPVIDGMQFTSKSALDNYLNKTMRPSLTVIGIDDIPSTATGGNVLRQEMSATISIRLPPWLEEDYVHGVIDKQQTTNVPYGAKVNVEYRIRQGFYSPPWRSDIQEMLKESAREAFEGRDMFFNNEGGSIPFMGKLTKRFPEAKFLVTGLLGPGSNAHCGDEMLYIPMLRNLMFTLTRFMEKSATTKW